MGGVNLSCSSHTSTLLILSPNTSIVFKDTGDKIGLLNFDSLIICMRPRADLQRPIGVGENPSLPRRSTLPFDLEDAVLVGERKYWSGLSSNNSWSWEGIAYCLLLNCDASCGLCSLWDYENLAARGWGEHNIIIWQCCTVYMYIQPLTFNTGLNIQSYLPNYQDMSQTKLGSNPILWLSYSTEQSSVLKAWESNSPSWNVRHDQ